MVKGRSAGSAKSAESPSVRIDPASSQEPRFIVDVMLGKLAKWLRILGYDTLYRRDWEDEELLARADAEDRVLLTADREVIQRRRGNKKVYISAAHWSEQLRQLAQTLPLSMEGVFTRCIECNVLLERLPKERARGQVPPYVFATQEEFGRCPVCGRIYWRGTHFAHALAAVESILKEEQEQKQEQR